MVAAFLLGFIILEQKDRWKDCTVVEEAREVVSKKGIESNATSNPTYIFPQLTLGPGLHLTDFRYLFWRTGGVPKRLLLYTTF